MINLLKDKKAVSPVIAVLLMVAIAVVAALITYSWVTGFVTTTTTKAGHAIQIQGANATSDKITIYVQNVGEGSVTLASTVFINGSGYSANWSPSTTLVEGALANATINVSGLNPNSPQTIRVVCTDGTFTEYKYMP